MPETASGGRRPMDEGDVQAIIDRLGGVEAPLEGREEFHEAVLRMNRSVRRSRVAFPSLSGFLAPDVALALAGVSGEQGAAVVDLGYPAAQRGIVLHLAGYVGQEGSGRRWSGSPARLRVAAVADQKARVLEALLPSHFVQVAAPALPLAQPAAFQEGLRPLARRCLPRSSCCRCPQRVPPLCEPDGAAALLSEGTAGSDTKTNSDEPFHPGCQGIRPREHSGCDGLASGKDRGLGLRVFGPLRLLQPFQVMDIPRMSPAPLLQAG